MNVTPPQSSLNLLTFVDFYKTKILIRVVFLFFNMIYGYFAYMYDCTKHMLGAWWRPEDPLSLELSAAMLLLGLKL